MLLFLGFYILLFLQQSMASFPLYAICPTKEDTGDFDIMRSIVNGKHNGFIFCIKNFLKHSECRDIAFWNKDVLCEGLRWSFGASNFRFTNKDSFICINTRVVIDDPKAVIACNLSYGVISPVYNDRATKVLLLNNHSHRNILLAKAVDYTDMELQIPPGLSIKNFLTTEGTLCVVIYVQLVRQGRLLD